MSGGRERTVELPARPRAGASRFTLPILAPVLAIFVTALAYQVSTGYGLQGLLMFVAASVGVLLLFVVSVRSIEVAVLLWLASLLGFRHSLLIPMPGLPDLTPDRILLLWIMAFVFTRIVAERQKAEKPYLADTLMVIHTLYLLGSVLVFNPTVINLWTRSYVMPTAAFFFGKYLLRDETWFRRMLWVFVVVTFYHSFTALAEKAGLNSLIWPQSIVTMKEEFRGRSVSIFGNPAVLGVYLGMMLPFHLYLFLTVRSRLLRYILGLAMVMIAFSVLFTYTRGGWLAAIAALGVLGLLGWRVYGQRLLVAGTLVVLLALVGGLGGLQQDQFLQERFATENTIASRVNALATATRMWLDNPVFGVGFYRYKDRQFDYRESMNVPVIGLVKAEVGTSRPLHDIYVGQLAEEGVVGMSVQVWLYALILLALWRSYRARLFDGTIYSSHIIPAIAAALAAYFVGGLTFDYRYFLVLNSLFYLFGGILIGWQARERAGRPPVFSETS